MAEMARREAISRLPPARHPHTRRPYALAV
jgi:hypothetical protein